MSASGHHLIGWILTPPQQARQACSRCLCSLPRFYNHLPRYISCLPCSFGRLPCHADHLSYHPTSTSLDCSPHLLDPLPCLLDPLTRLLDPLLRLLDPLLCCLHPLLCRRHFPPLHLPPLFSCHTMRLRDPVCSQTMNSSVVLTRPPARSPLIASLSIRLMRLWSTQRRTTGETSLSPTFSTFTLTRSITRASTSSIRSEMNMADMGRSLARCCRTRRASQSNARSCTQHVGLLFFLCAFAWG